MQSAAVDAPATISSIGSPCPKGTWDDLNPFDAFLPGLIEIERHSACGEGSSHMKVKEIMTSDACRPGDDVRATLATMKRQQVRRLPVVGTATV
jgi:CBS domain-containing protein